MSLAADAEDLYMHTAVVPFDRDFGFLGANTNGAPPQAAFGLCVEAQICTLGDEVDECYWIKVATDPKSDGITGSENIMFTQDLRDIEKVLGSIAVASRSASYYNQIQGDFQYHLNTAQILHAGDADPSPTDDIDACHVRATPEGFSLRFADNHACLASLEAKLSAPGVLALLKGVASLREIRDAKFNELSRAIEKAKLQAQESADAPRM